MLPLLTATAFGYWLCRHVNLIELDGYYNLEAHTEGIAADLIWLWTTFAAICLWVIATGRASRLYANSVLIPWLSDLGLSLPPVPALSLPSAPAR
jgi:hypothetical protein